MAQAIRNNQRPPAPTLSPACADCLIPPDCVDPACSATNVLTAQCTDQCVVIACNDPDHAASVCDGAGGSAHCDLVCDTNMDCTDCNGFDAFLQCCEDYHQQPPDPRSPQYNPSSYIWDSAFDELWCACNEVDKGSVSHVQKIGATTISPFLAPLRTPENILEKGVESMDIDDSAFEERILPSPIPRAQTTPESSPTTYGCSWGSCRASFPAMDDLIGHVNSYHLGPEPTPTSESQNQVNSPNVTTINSPSACRWNECQNPDHFKGSTETLFNHLMNEHFKSLSQTAKAAEHGLELRTLPPIVVSDDMATEDVTHEQIKLSGPVPTPAKTTEDAHQCDGTHQCHWADCGFFFRSCDALTAHITSAHIGGGKPHYECFWDNCHRNGEQGFQSKQKICRHVQSHTGHRPFQCSICNQNFSEAATLQQHIRRHTQEKPYSCDFPGCGKSFAITGALTIHKRTHNGDKPFKCSFCDRGFAESSNLSKHLRTHTGARPYVCTEPGCSKAFARPDQLTRHKGVHRRQTRGVGQLAVEL